MPQPYEVGLLNNLSYFCTDLKLENNDCWNLVAKRVSNCFIRGNTPIFSRMFFLLWWACFHFFYFSVKQIVSTLIYYHFATFFQSLISGFWINYPVPDVGRNPKMFQDSGQLLLIKCPRKIIIFQSFILKHKRHVKSFA